MKLYYITTIECICRQALDNPDYPYSRDYIILELKRNKDFLISVNPNESYDFLNIFTNKSLILGEFEAIDFKHIDLRHKYSFSISIYI